MAWRNAGGDNVISEKAAEISANIFNRGSVLPVQQHNASDIAWKTGNIGVKGGWRCEENRLLIPFCLSLSDGAAICMYVLLANLPYGHDASAPMGLHYSLHFDAVRNNDIRISFYC